MTADEMADAIVDIVTRYGNVTFPELVSHLGEQARGDQVITLAGRDDLVLWAGVSETFAVALNACRDRIEPQPTMSLLYLMDGGYLSLPVAKRVTAKPYKAQHWIPVVLNPRPTAVPA